VNSPHSSQPLQINVGFLLNQPIGTSRDIHFDLAELSLSSDLEVKDFNGLVRITRTPQGMLVQGDFNSMIQLECVRCLEESPQPLSVEFSELYAFKSKSATESNLILPEDGKINLTPLVREYMLLEIPISPLCKPDCLGLCIICGTNLNEGLCEHQAAIQTE